MSKDVVSLYALSYNKHSPLTYAWHVMQCNLLLCFPLHCSAVVHSGDVLGELVGGCLHLQMAHLSIIHHVLNTFLCVSYFALKRQNFP